MTAGRSVVVVGGGIVGLTVAHRLAATGCAVTVLEGASEAGGLAAGWSVPTPEGPITWDRYYHVILETDTALRGLLRELDLDASVHWGTTRTGAFVDGRLAPVSSPADYARLPGLSPVAKARIAATIGRGATTRDWRALEAVTAEAWLTRWSGRAAFERFWVPLLSAKLGTAWPEANAAFIWATIQRLTGARRAGVREERFGVVPGGYGRIVATLVDHLRSRGVTVRTGVTVAQVRGGAPATVVTTAGEELTADDVVLTTTPRVAATICPDLPPATASAYRAIAYQGVVCVALVLDRPLSRVLPHLPLRRAAVHGDRGDDHARAPGVGRWPHARVPAASTSPPTTRSTTSPTTRSSPASSPASVRSTRLPDGAVLGARVARRPRGVPAARCSTTRPASPASPPGSRASRSSTRPRS